MLDMMLNGANSTMVGILAFLATATLTFSIMAVVRVQGSVKRRAANLGRVRFGVPASLMISRTMHVITMLSLVALAWATPLPPFYFAGVAVVGALLVYEQSLVRADDLSQVKRAFDMNGYVGILYLFVLAVSIYVL